MNILHSIICFLFVLLEICNGFCARPSHARGISRSKQQPSSAKLYSSDLFVDGLDIDSSRRQIFSKAAASLITLSTAQLAPNEVFAEDVKVLVLGGTGFVGSQIVKQLKSLGVTVISTSTDGRDGTVALNVLDANVGQIVEQQAKGCTAVISTIGAIGTPDDGAVNGASGLAATAAKAVGVKKFVYISVAPEVREVAQGISFLDNYMEGKAFSEDAIKAAFGGDAPSYTLIEPTFIYGGDKFALNPPRVSKGYGSIVEAILSSPPFRAAAGVAPGFVGVALEPPVPVEAVAGSAVAAALGKINASVLDTYDKIKDAAKLIQ